MNVLYTTNKENTTSKPDLIWKLLAYALDPSASLPEAENAARRMVGVARRSGTTINDLRNALAAPNTDPTPPAAEVVLNFGKHAGRTLGDIARNDPAYVEWLAENYSKEWLRNAASIVLDWISGEGVAA
ncbi:MAG: hypothetical protein IT446_14230 [Phycisphaerales bacterium]|nr:hypothetical protein [Phycisphaerales bacterium]